jgi:hypothetical protein
MYWIHRWFEKIANSLRAESSEIKNALQDNKKAIDAAKISQDNAWSGVGRQIAEMRSDDEYKRGANTYKHKSYRQQVVLNILTGLLAIFTLGAFAAAGIYACIANRQLGIMREATTNAEDAMKIDQRAWVTVSNIKRESGNVVVSFGNSGKTPAKNFTVHISGEPIPKDKEPSLGAEDLLPGIGVIAPNGFFHVPLDASGYFDPKTTRLAIHGRVDYADIFSSPHRTTFCYYLSSTNNQDGFAPCGRGNETDDQPTK